MLSSTRIKAVAFIFAASSLVVSQPAFSNEELPEISQFGDEIEFGSFFEAKDKLRKALDAYKLATASNISERYKTALSAYKEAAKELVKAKGEVLKEFNATVKEANSELSKFKNSKPKPTALKLAAATKAKDAKIAEAVTARDAALSELGSIGAEPAKPPKVTVPTPSPTKKKSA